MEDSLQSAKAKLEKLGGMFVPNSAPGELVTGAIADIDAYVNRRGEPPPLEECPYIFDHKGNRKPNPNYRGDASAQLPSLTLDADESQRKSRTVKAPKSPVAFEIEL